MANGNEDVLLSVGFDISSIPKQISTIERVLKSQKLIANIAYQFGTPQAQVRNEFKSLLQTLKSDASTNPIDLNIGGLAASSLPRLRYALYDVGNAANNAAQSLANFTQLTVSAAADYETAFTAVERTTGLTGRGLQVLNQQLISLSTQIPLAFKDITGIASLGAQLGVANSDLAGFTKNVSEFAAVTNVSAESAAQAFGALGELLNIQADQYANLGSAIAYAGVKSVATESEILAVATAIGGVAASANLSAQDVVALSTSLASLRVPAEQSRGALTRVFTEINRASSDGGVQLEAFAQVLGITAAEAQNLASTDMNAFFNQFVAGLSGMSSAQLTQTLDALNLADIRVTNTLSRLSGNLELVQRNQDIVNQSFADGTFLSVAYASKVDDIASRFQILVNNLNTLAATAGKALTPLLGPFIDLLNKLAVGFNVILSGPGGQIFAAFAIGAVALGATLLGLITVVALSTAGIYAFKTAFDGLHGSGSILDNKLTQLIAKMLGIKFAAQEATVGTNSLSASLNGVAAAEGAATAGANGFKTALVGSGIGIAVVLLGTLASAFMAAGSSANIANGIFADTSGLSNALAADTAARNAALSAGNLEVANSYVELSSVTDTNTEKVKSNYDAMSQAADVLGIVGPSYDALNAAVDSNTQYLGANTTAWVANRLMQNETFQSIASNADFRKYAKAVEFNLGDMLKAQAKNGRQGVIDYFNALEQAAIAKGTEFQSILTKIGRSTTGAASVLRISSQAAGGQVSSLLDLTGGLVDAALLGSGALNSLGSAGNDASTGLENLDNSIGSVTPKIRTLLDYSNDLSSIFSRAFDIRFSGQSTLDSITSSFAKIAEETARASEEINKLNADISKLTADKALKEYFLSVAEAYGDTLRAAQLRAELAQIDADLARKNKDLAKQQDKTNKTLVGSSEAAIDNRAEILNLVKSYQDHIKALAASGMSQQQLASMTEQLRQDFISQATQLGYNESELQTYAAAFGDVSVAIANVPRDITIEANTDPALQALNEFVAQAKASIGGGLEVPVKVITAEQRRLRIDPSDVQFYNLALRSGRMSAEAYDRAVWEYYSSGGYTGAGGKYEVAGIVHRGEYVVPKEQVNQTTGLPYYMSQPRSFASGGFVAGTSGPSTMIVELSPTDRQLLARAGNVQLSIDGRVIAGATNNANYVSALRGSN